MNSTYTFFRNGTFSRGAIVYSGDIESKDWAEQNGLEPEFEIKLHMRSLSLERNPIAIEKATTLLSGKYEGFCRRSARIEGFHSLTTAKRAGIFSCGWSFVDFMSNEFKWNVSMWGTSWTLRDINGNDVAQFKRTSFSIKRIGTLTILEEKIPESLLMLILLTCKMVHESIKESERSHS
ncbi:hypothetical protein GGI05_007507 [Coemansia sp. RSA 2603]|nr:hypothetical protein GGI05_007507 [Coemansia sp. RSA 2603]